MLRKLFVAVALSGLGVGIGASVCAAQRATLDRIMHTDSLDNGMQIIVVENHSVPIVTAELVFRAGAMTQKEDDQGVPHLFEHMLFRSYRGGDGQPFGSDAGRAQAAYNGATSDEDVSYYLALPSQNANDALDILARLVREPRFLNDDFQRERFVVLNELERDASDPRFHLSREADMRLWGVGFLRKNTIGEQMALMGVTTAKLQAIFQQYYVPNNSALIISGDVSPARAIAMAREHFGTWKRRPDPFVSSPVASMPPLDTSRAVVLTGNVTTIDVEIEWQGPSVPVDVRSTYAADVVSEILADDESDFHSHLIDSGLFQEASIRYSTRAHVGPIRFHGVTTAAKLAAALTALATEFEFMDSPNYFTPASIAAATKRNAVADVFRLENAHALAASLGETWAVAGTEYFRNYSENMSSVTANDLHAYVHRYVARKPFVIAALVPDADANMASETIAGYLSMVNQ